MPCSQLGLGLNCACPPVGGELMPCSQLGLGLNCGCPPVGGELMPCSQLGVLSELCLLPLLEVLEVN